MESINVTDMEGKKCALVLSGGVVKAGAWHLGVIYALQELGFSFRSGLIREKKHPPSPQGKLEIGSYVGSSAGALVSIYMANGFSPEDIIGAFLKKKHGRLKGIGYKDILSLRTAMKRPPKSNLYGPFDGLPFAIKQFLAPVAHFSGLFSTVGIVNYLKDNVLKTVQFDELDCDLFIVATQLDHSRKVIFSKYHYPNPPHDPTASYYTNVPIMDAAAASMSVPPFYCPYPIRNPQTSHIDYYIDGEIRETLSTHVAIDNQCEYIISSWTHTPYHYHEEVGSLINYGLPAIAVQSIYLMIQKKIMAARAQRIVAKDILSTVNEYMVNQNFSNYHRRNILNILERKLNYQPQVKLIDIFPKHDNYEIFFSSFFSLNPEKTSKLIKMGHDRTMEIFGRK